MKHYLVTGGAGFIGSHLVDALLVSGHQVTVLDDLSAGKAANLDPRATLIEGDVADLPTMAAAMKTVDGCFHLAAIASVVRCRADRLGTQRTNVGGMLAVLAAATARRVPVVYASSAAIYGDNPALPLMETALPAPISAYGLDKWTSELNAALAARDGVPTTGLRFFNIFGPRQDPASPYSGVISIFAGRAASRQPITIFGDGEQTRDFIYVMDAVRALCLAMEKTIAGAAVYNICSGQATSLLQLVAALGDCLGWQPELIFSAPRADDIKASLGDPSYFRKVAGFIPATPLAEALQETLI